MLIWSSRLAHPRTSNGWFSALAAPITALKTPSSARIVPANRFEVLECTAALQAVQAGELDGDGMPSVGGLDVLCQHILTHCLRRAVRRG